MTFITALPEGLLQQRLYELSAADANAGVAKFSESNKLACPSGCGSCCEDFIPDILPVEASLLAVYLAVSNHELACQLALGSTSGNKLGPQLFSGDREGCPLYRADSPYHCTVYEARPLICRMFPFAAMRAKDGQSRFSPCRLMPGALDFARAAAAVPVPPPVFADFGYRILMIDPDQSNRRAPLHEALPRALAEALFLIGLREHDPDSNDPGFTPLPRAS